MTTKLAIVCDLDVLQRWMDWYVDERGDGDRNQLMRQLVLTDFLLYLTKHQQSFQETMNAKSDNQLSEPIQFPQRS